MEEVKRYTIDFSDGETAEGVLYTDYAALKARVAELDHDRIIREAYEAEFGKLDELRERIAKTTDAQHLAQLVTNKARDYAKDERDSLRAQLEAAKFRIAVLEEELNVAADKLVCDRCGKIGLHRCLPALQNICSTPQLTAQPDGVRFFAQLLVDNEHEKSAVDMAGRFHNLRQALAASAPTKED